MNTLIRYRTLVFTLIYTTPLLLSLSGCGGGESVSTNPASDELKKSEASYEAEIAKQKAATKTTK